MVTKFITTLNLSFVLAVAVTPMANADEWPQCQLSLPSGVVTPFDSVQDSAFGASLAATGDLMAVGAPFDDGSAPNAGAVYLLRKIADEWTHEAKVFAPLASSTNPIGQIVAATGDIVVASGYSLIGVGLGKAEVFRRVEGAWQHEQRLEAPDEAVGDNFGRALAVDGDWIIVGARLDDDLGNASGSAYLWHYKDGAWTMRQKLLASGGEALDAFGSAVAIDGTTAVVMTRSNETGPTRWHLFVYEFDGKAWILDAMIPCASAAATANVALTHEDGHLLVSIGGTVEVWSFAGSRLAFEASVAPPPGYTFSGDPASIEGDLLVVSRRNPQTECGFVYRNVGEWRFERRLLPPEDAGQAGAPQADVHVDAGGILANVGSVIAQYDSAAPPDCDGDGESDACEITAGASDYNLNNVPDECESFPCPADIAPPEGDGEVNVEDLLAVIGAWGTCADPRNCPADVAPPAGDDAVNVQDLLAVIGAWGSCP